MNKVNTHWARLVLKGHPACKKTEWWGAGVVICLEQGADFGRVYHLDKPTRSTQPCIEYQLWLG